MISVDRHRIRLASLLMVALVSFRASAAEASPLAGALVELESHINWSAVDNAWKNIRPRWITTTSACTNPECVGQQLVELEANVNWKAIDPAWTKRRMAWVNDCKSATTHVEVAKLLLEFEQNVGWQAVDQTWKRRRDGWIARVKSS